MDKHTILEKKERTMIEINSKVRVKDYEGVYVVKTIIENEWGRSFNLVHSDLVSEALERGVGFDYLNSINENELIVRKKKPKENKLIKRFIKSLLNDKDRLNSLYNECTTPTAKNKIRSLLKSNELQMKLLKETNNAA